MNNPDRIISSNEINALRGSISQAIKKANARYIERKGSAAMVDSVSGLQKDLARSKKTFSEMHDQTLITAINAIGKGFVTGISNVTGSVKTVMRLPQVLNFVATGDPSQLTGSALLMVTGLAHLKGSQPVNKAGMFFAHTGMGNENTSDEVNVSNARRIAKAMGKVSPSTFETQYSVSFKHGNLAFIMGIGSRPAGSTKLPDIDWSNQATIAIIQAVDALTEGALLDMIERANKTKNR